MVNARLETLNVHFANVHFSFRSGGFPPQRFELEWSLLVTSLEGFAVTSHRTGYQGPLLKEYKEYEGHPLVP